MGENKGRKIAQGSTEYLILLAVVLVIALVVITMLVYPMGTISDAKLTQSQSYWVSASPIAIVESGARFDNAWPSVSPYLRFRNTGTETIKITKIISGNTSADSFGVLMDDVPFGDTFTLAPGDESYIGLPMLFPGVTTERHIHINRPSDETCDDANDMLCSAQALCSNLSWSPGYLVIPNLGFEYEIETGGQRITRRQLSDIPLIVRCTVAYDGGPWWIN